ncbi:hypothetical protein [Parafrankia sp. FMc2]|uniref:hypothetical protein n=1 Tax=Parafrankia sp. FMc2 TaxID=3233196 RepID=UPI0034D5D849
MASGADDATVRSRDASTPTAPTPLDQPLTDHTGDATSVALSPDGRTLATASNDRTVRLRRAG